MRKSLKRSVVLFSLLFFVLITIGIGLLTSTFITFKGVPLPIIVQFLVDEPARKEYFAGDKKGLHDRLQQMGIEEEIKAFYRPKIQDENKLDQYIHQIFYNSTGYVGEGYFVNSQGLLVPKVSPASDFEQWFELAYRAGIVVSSRHENGIQYVISPQGTVAPYQEIAAIFPLSELKKLIQAQP
jgi:hypothetical protein